MKQIIQTSLFDIPLGNKLKEDGMDIAAQNRAAELKIAKRLAIDIATQHPDRLCTIDDVQRKLIPMDINLGLAAGSVFKDKDLWEFTGRHIKTQRTSSHRRDIKIWRLIS